MVGARLAFIVLAAVLITMVAGVQSAGACSCAFGLSPKKQLKNADGAFIGRLLGVRSSQGSTEAAFRYRVGQVFKGHRRLHRGKVVTVWDEYNDTDCALPERTGRAYGLFLSRQEGRWTSSLCGVLSPRRMRRAARHEAGSSRSPSSGEAGCSA